METNFVKVSDSGFRSYVVDLKRNNAVGFTPYLSQHNGAHHSVLKSSSLNLGKRKKPDVCKTNCRTCKHHPSQKCLARYYMNFMKSGLPKRVMFYQNEGWVAHGSDVIDIVRKEFAFKKAAVEVKLNGLHLVFDFIRMCQFNFFTDLELPIAWIDEYDSCFFPEVYTDVDEQQNEEEFSSTEDGVQEIKLQIEIDLNGVGDNKVLEYCGETSPLVKRIKIGPNAEVEEVVGENQHLEKNLDYFVEKENPSVDKETVREMFLDGMNRDDEINVVGIGSNSGSMWQGRLGLFMKQTEITEKIRGNANVCYAWLGSTKEASSGIMEHGLGHFGLKQMKSAYGIGVHLVPANCANTSAKYCDVDENGVRYMVLCRVIMGSMEMVHTGSKQFHPSNENFDSGVDDLKNPRHYVVWSMNINTHIYPEYVVSFKVPTNREGSQHETLRVTVHEKPLKPSKVADAIDMVGDNQSNITFDKSMERSASMNSTTVRVPKSPWMPFPILLAAIAKQVPSKDMKGVLVHYDRFRKKMISRVNFVKHLRLIVGDTILKTTLIELNGKLTLKNGISEGAQNQEIAG